MFNSIPKHSGIYLVKDNINNLQIKIHFQAINSLLKLAKFNLPITQENDKRDKEKVIKTPDENIEEYHVVTIKWQQKLLSPSEYELYSDLKNCTTDQQKKYFEIINAERKSLSGRDRKQAGKKKRQRKQTKPADDDIREAKLNFIFTYIHQDNFVPNSDATKDSKNEKDKDKASAEMYIYAALKPDTQLAVLKYYDRERLLYIYPDFTVSQNQPYFISIDSDYRHLYSYGIEDNSSKALLSTNEQAQFLYLPELPIHWRLNDDFYKQFEMPPKRTQRFSIIFTVNELAGFEYDNVHIRYHIRLPENTLLEEGLLDASSHTAAGSSFNAFTHIGLSWQITILCEEQYDPSQHLFLFFEVVSIDSWERERIEGYCHYTLSLLKPCHHIIKLHCIRPVESFWESLNRYFIGGRRQFDYKSFICERFNDKESENTLNFYCRYGSRMQNSGELNLTCQMLSQRNCELLNPSSSRSIGMTLDDIMMAYKEARRRLEAAALK